ncbi:MAG: hypothetical protein WC083_02195 [Candidatus Methanomethylophilaceae archaeon]
MDMMLATAGVLAILPAFLVLYFSLRKYTYPAVEDPFFSDPKMFGLMVVGMIEGTVIFVAYTYFAGVWSSLLVALLIGILTEVVKLVTLNLKRFHGQSDTVFYGFSLGIGTAIAMAGGMTFYLGSIASAGGGIDAATWFIIIVYVVQQILLHPATGATIGEGVARLRIGEFLIQAVIVSAVYQILMTPAWAAEGVWIYLSALVALAGVLFYFLRVVLRYMPRVVQDVLKMQGDKRRVPR